MALYLYNTLTKQNEEFKPIQPGKVRIYTCGPTVYSHPHIGNFRAFIATDLLRRYLEYKGYQVYHIMNITDVGHMTTDDMLAGGEGEDKILAAARQEQKSPWEIARFYENEFKELVKLLNLKPADVYPRATEHIPEMIILIEKLFAKGYAYEINGNVYYAVSKFKNYGRLSGNTLENLMSGARVEVNPEKRSPLDFALWKNDPKHIMQWDSPWGKGFPGWHIECSVMSMKYLGETFDIHTGGEDNIFPHHECEIAQSEAANEKKFVNYWFHTRHLLVHNQKMSKSLGNFHTVRDILDKGYQPRVLRYALLNTHYRQSLNFTLDGLEAARNAIQRLLDFKRLTELKAKSDPLPYGKKLPRVEQLIKETKDKFESSMDDDLNISEALGSIFEFIREINKLGLLKTEAKAVLDLIDNFDTVLGILQTEKVEEISPELKALIEQRELARQQKDYQKADTLRAQLETKGIILEDTPDGVRWKNKL